LVSAVGCLTLAWIAARQLSAGQLSLFGRALTLERSLVILGRTWALTRSSLAALALIYAMAGLTFLLALPAAQGWSFYPFGVSVLGVLSLAITAQQYVYAILFIWLAANLAVFVLAGGRPGETTAALRFLVLTSVAMMPLLILPRYLEPDPAGYVVALRMDDAPLPDNAVQIATMLMVGGMMVLLMMVPFHGQIVSTGTHSAPMALPLLLSTMPVVVLHTLFQLWQAQPALSQDPLFFQVCRSMGTAAALIGGLAAIGQRRWGTLAGYATLVDWGAGLIALGQGTMGAADLAVRMAIWRGWSLLLVGAGENALFKAAGRRDSVECWPGLFRRRPLSLSTLLVGLLALAGYPLTPGAAGRWPLLTLLVTGPSGLSTDLSDGLTRLTGMISAQPAAVVALLVGGVGVSVGTVASVCACLGVPQSNAPMDGSQTKMRATESSQEPSPPDNIQENNGSDRIKATRREAFDAVVSAGFSLLALWLVGSFFLSPQPWLKLGQELLGNVAWPGS
jgi:formate hydrogenlyase subunit 3/multisubunit Na+/H+ antiporter MnhD subunit